MGSSQQPCEVYQPPTHVSDEEQVAQSKVSQKVQNQDSRAHGLSHHTAAPVPREMWGEPSTHKQRLPKVTSNCSEQAC